MFSTGCRIGEIISLEKDDINWSNRNCKMVSCSPIHPFCKSYFSFAIFTKSELSNLISSNIIFPKLGPFPT
ncbi:hypothetical protein [Viridibacillus arvi]|uniref:hypothetical protein n=1 Tax=Viridibacillus arvi TaxID=263475 RepID=UPI003D2C9043